MVLVGGRYNLAGYGVWFRGMERLVFEDCGVGLEGGCWIGLGVLEVGVMYLLRAVPRTGQRVLYLTLRIVFFVG